MSWNIPGVPFGPKNGLYPSSLCRYICGKDAPESGSLWVQVHVSSSLSFNHTPLRSSFNSLWCFCWCFLFSGILALVQVACPKHTFGWCFYTMHGSLNFNMSICFSEARAAVHVLFSHLQWWILVLFSCAVTKACLSSWCFTSSRNWRVLSSDRWRGQIPRWFLVHNPIGFLVTKLKENPWHSPIPRRK